MALTLHDIKARLAQQREIDVLEILDISTEDLVERFEDLIIEKMDVLEEELEDDDNS